jgi:hypothetical protein
MDLTAPPKDFLPFLSLIKLNIASFFLKNYKIAELYGVLMPRLAQQK